MSLVIIYTIFCISSVTPFESCLYINGMNEFYIRERKGTRESEKPRESE